MLDQKRPDPDPVPFPSCFRLIAICNEGFDSRWFGVVPCCQRLRIRPIVPCRCRGTHGIQRKRVCRWCVKQTPNSFKGCSKLLGCSKGLWGLRILGTRQTTHPTDPGKGGPKNPDPPNGKGVVRVRTFAMEGCGPLLRHTWVSLGVSDPDLSIGTSPPCR